jgi:superfamily II DNA or RNA helicase
VTFTSGSLVRTRGREWVVQAGSDDDFLLLRPLGGTDDEVTGILTALEEVDSAQFALPDPTKPGDYLSSRLLRDALRLGFRSSAGPFRSFGEIAVEPRPYQLVPLLMALKLDPVRLLIADDVGIGKTIEAALVARELIDQRDVQRLAVLCPPHLAEQWQRELRDKFHIDAELVLASTAGRLERGIGLGQSLFEAYPYVVVSIDFIKSDRRRDEFIRTCPELVIVDEAHGCAFGAERGGRQQRHELVRRLSEDLERHLLLVTATPHSGKEAAFRSLLGLLDKKFGELPDDLGGAQNERHRRRLAQHLVQRRRADIRQYLDTDTPFPAREEREETYALTSEYKRFFERVLDYVRETVRDPEGGQHRQRVRWWSALALLRSLASSPAAAADTLRNRAAPADTETTEEADDVGRRTVLDLTDDESTEGIDVPPGSDYSEESEGEESRTRRRLRDMAKEAEALRGKSDAKLQKAITLVREFVADGYRPIVFCRFIPTAEYVAEKLREALKGVEVVAVTGRLPSTERERRVMTLAESPKRVLVATDCLSEGVNLQEHFDAVLHYDLTWNPTRHEQREGRVDRYGQPKEKVRVLTYYGTDNQIDGIVLDVLIRKHKAIRNSLGISVPVPVDTDAVIEAIAEGLLLRDRRGSATEQLRMFDEFIKPMREDLYVQWDAAADREKRSRTMFAQELIKVDEVARELRETQAAVGSGADVARFIRRALQMQGAVVLGTDPISVDLAGTPKALQDAIGKHVPFTARFQPSRSGESDTELYLSRTHPIVDGLAAYVLDTALDPQADGIAARCGVIRTARVTRRTTLLLIRYRFDLIRERGDEQTVLLAEDAGLLAFEGAPETAAWLDAEQADGLLGAEPAGNVSAQQATEFVRRVTDGYEHLSDQVNASAHERAESLRQAHDRVRVAARMKGIRFRVEPKLPPDALGIYVLIPSAATEGTE